MTYGNPPLETVAAIQGFDPGDVSPNGTSDVLSRWDSVQVHLGRPNTKRRQPGGYAEAAGTAYFAAIRSRLLDPVRAPFALYN